MKKFFYILLGLIAGLIIVQVIVYVATMSASTPVSSDVVPAAQNVAYDPIPIIDEPSSSNDVQAVEKMTPQQTNESEDIKPVYEAPIQGVVIVN